MSLLHVVVEGAVVLATMFFCPSNSTTPIYSYFLLDMTQQLGEIRPENQLRRLIEAQVQGGSEKFAWLRAADIVSLKDSFAHFTYSMGGKSHHVLELLLDPEGLKAAYGDDIDRIPCGYPIEMKNDVQRLVASFIVDSWLEGGAESAIKTAFDLLPLKV